MSATRLPATISRLPLVPIALTAVTVHLVLSALFYMEAGLAERLAWAVLAVLALGAFGYGREGLSRPWRGLLLLAVGLPAVFWGIGVHASHVVQAGWATADITGIPLLVAGLVLSVAGTVTLVRLVHTWWRRLFLVPLGAVLSFFLVFPAGMGVFAANVARVPCCDETPADRGMAYEDVTFPTHQGLELSAWYVPTRNGAVVITVHGAGSNRSTVMEEAELLAKHGYGVLMVDLEGFGDSEGRGNAFGWVGARDIDAAVAYLQTRADVDPARIGGLGRSMGGEVLIQAAAQTPGLAAIVSEGVSGRTAADFAELDDGFFELIVPFHVVINTTMTLISGESAPPPLKDMAAAIGPRPVLLIAASINEETELGALYVKVGGPSFEMWTIPEARHIAALELHPKEYEQRVVGFFDSGLLGKGPAAAR